MKEVNFGIYREEEKKNKRISAIVTFGSVALLILILFWVGLYAQVPPPEEEGIRIAYGDPDAGRSNTYNEQTQSNPQSSSSPDQENDMTQDSEDAPEIQEQNDNNQSVTNPNTTQNSDEPQRPDTRTFTDRSNQDGQGNNDNDGNQGARDGIVGGDPLGIGDGNGGNGLGGRGTTKRPSGKNTCGHAGTIRIKIGVDQKGIVKSAELVTEGSSIIYAECVSQAKQIARQYRFAPDPNAPAIAYGIVEIKLTMQ